MRSWAICGYRRCFAHWIISTFRKYFLRFFLFCFVLLLFYFSSFSFYLIEDDRLIGLTVIFWWPQQSNKRDFGACRVMDFIRHHSSWNLQFIKRQVSPNKRPTTTRMQERAKFKTGQKINSEVRAPGDLPRSFVTSFVLFCFSFLFGFVLFFVLFCLFLIYFLIFFFLFVFLLLFFCFCLYSDVPYLDDEKTLTLPRSHYESSSSCHWGRR